MIIMETERLELRELNDDDISVLYSIFSDAETMKYYPSSFNFFQQKSPTSMGGVMKTDLSTFQSVYKHPLKEVKASGGCHGIGNEFFVQAQSRSLTQLCRGIIDFTTN